jgi:hypothetical protein
VIKVLHEFLEVANLSLGSLNLGDGIVVHPIVDVDELSLDSVDETVHLDLLLGRIASSDQLDFVVLDILRTNLKSNWNTYSQDEYYL